MFKIKRKADGIVERFKARLVAKGYNPFYGVDYLDSFSPVEKMVAIQFMFALATIKRWEIHQLDVNNAFLHGHLSDKIYMDVPQGYTKGQQGDTKGQQGEVCKLTRSLYGLKQASREWNSELCSKLSDFGLSQSSFDHCLFTMQDTKGFLAMLVYVDDVLITSSNPSLITQLKEYLDSRFTIKDLGPAKYFLGMEIIQDLSGLHLCQRKYIQDILEDVGLKGCKPSSTPLPHGIHLQIDDGIPLPDPERYRRLIGRLLYLNLTRPNVTYATQQLNQLVNSPCSSHWDAAVH